MAENLLAQVADLAHRASMEIEGTDPQATSLLSMASSLVRAYLGPDTDDILIGTEGAADAVRDVTVDVAYRVWSNPDGLVGDGVDDATRRWSERTASEGFYLTAANKLILDGLRPRRRHGLWTLGTERGEDHLGTIYVPTGPPPSGYPFPWYASDDPLVQ